MNYMERLYRFLFKTTLIFKMRIFATWKVLTVSTITTTTIMITATKLIHISCSRPMRYFMMRSGELVRAWITNGHLSLSLNAMAFGKADIWGHVLAGMAEQVAASCAEMGHGTTAGNLEEILNNLTADLAKAAAKHSPLSVKS